MSTMAVMTIAMASTDSRMPRTKTMGRSSVMRGYPRQAVLHPVDCVPPHHAESQVKSAAAVPQAARRSAEHTSEIQSLMRISYAVFCLKKKQTHITHRHQTDNTQNNST